MSGTETQRLADLQHKIVYDIVKEALGEILTNDGKLALRTAPIQGPLRKGGGGTGNNWGFADHAHSGGNQGQKLAEANTHESLNTDPATAIHWTREMIQDMVAAFLIDQLGNTFSYNDAGNQLTIAGTLTLDQLIDVAITDPQNGDILMLFKPDSERPEGMWRNVHGVPPAEEGLLYIGGEWLTVGGAPITSGG